jgi:hypothetical protein
LYGLCFSAPGRRLLDYHHCSRPRARRPLLLFEGDTVARPRSVIEATEVPFGPEEPPLYRQQRCRAASELPASETEVPEPRARHLDCLPTTTAYFTTEPKEWSPTQKMLGATTVAGKLPQTELLAGEEAPRERDELAECDSQGLGGKAELP